MGTDGQTDNARNDAATEQNKQQDAGRTFTQQQLEQIINERLMRERDKYRDYDALKAAATELEQLKSAQATEAQRVQGQLEQATKETEELRRKYLAAAAENAAARAGALYPDLVAAKIPTDALEDEARLAETLAGIRQQYPALFGRAGGTADGGAGGSAPTAGVDEWIRRAVRGSS